VLFSVASESGFEASAWLSVASENGFEASEWFSVASDSFSMAFLRLSCGMYPVRRTPFAL
jgi:hypothetical protein